VISGVAAEMKDSARMPRCCVYQFLDAETDFTVRTRWSRDVMVAEGLDVVDISSDFDVSAFDRLGQILYR
jgi:hypothetical protein